MQIKRRIFPYPIINHDKSLSNFGNLDFELLFDEEIDEENYILNNLRFNLDNEEVMSLYNEGKIKVVVIIECSYTVYRRAFEISNTPTTLKLSKNDLSEKVYISMFAYATEDLKITFDSVEEDYKNIEFEYEKYDIIAGNDGYNIYFQHDEDEDNICSSIFDVIINRDADENYEKYQVDCTTAKKIIIRLPEKLHALYTTVYAVPSYKEVFFNMILIPALIKGLTECQNYLNENPNKDMDDLSNTFIWFRGIIKSYKKFYGKELTLEEFKKDSVVELSQDLLGKPVCKALQALIDVQNKNDEEEDN